jgi:hypothetical protein
MNNERILAHNMAKKLSIDEIKDVSAAGTSVTTAHPTHNPSGTDMDMDVLVDM